MRILTVLSLAGLALTQGSLAFAGVPAATPGPVLGLVAGPWGLVAAGVGYGAYRAYKALR